MRCDVDDILCQMELLQGLKVVQKTMGSEAFLEKFPELQGLAPRIAQEVESQEGSLRETLESCSSEEEIAEGMEVAEVAEVAEGESEEE